MKRTAFLRRDSGTSKAQTPIPRKRNCEHCKTPFQQTGSFIVWCSPSCGYEVAQARLAKAEAKRAKAERKADKAKREKLRTRSDWLKLAQTAFNRFIRTRDEKAGLPCISCQRFHQGSYDAGHYRTVGSSPALRFDEAQVHRQCVPCNQHLHGNTVAYRAGLIARVGIAEVERIEGPHEPLKLSIDDLKGIVATYRAQARALERQT